MKLLTSMRHAMVAVAAVTALHGTSAMACALHGGMFDFATVHPRSIEIALAVRAAFDSGALRSLPALPPSLGLQRAGWLLRGSAVHVTALTGATHGTVAVLLVESGIWARYTFNGSGVASEVHVSGPHPNEPSIVTSEAVLSALAGGELTALRAVELGVVVLGAVNGA